MSLYPIQPSFAAGEIAPSLWGRVDLQKYQVGLKLCSNFIIQPHGGVTRRPGTRFITIAKGACRLVPFIYNSRDSYVLEFSDKTVRFFKNGSPVKTADGSVYELQTPYGAENLHSLKFAQSADTLFIAHRSFPPAKIVRYADARWQWSQLIIDGGPFREQSDAESKIKLKNSADDGNVTITASAPLFDSNNLGQLVELIQQIDEQRYQEKRDAATLTETSSVTFSSVPSVAYCTGQVYVSGSGGDGGDGDDIDHGWDGDDSDTPDDVGGWDGIDSDDSGLAGADGVDSSPA